MNIYKTIFVIVLCSLCISTMAESRFIVKYKLSEAQKASLLDNSENIEEQIRKQLMEKELSHEQLRALSIVASNVVANIDTLPTANNIDKADIDTVSTAINDIQIEYLYPLATGAHVIALNKNLDRARTIKFINKVGQFDDVEYIEEDQKVSLSNH